MIRIDSRNPDELIVSKEELEKLMSLDENKELLSVTMEDITKYEEKEHAHLENIRVERNTALGKLLFEVAREDIKEDKSEIVPSVLWYVANMMPTADYLTEVEKRLKQEDEHPSDYTVEQILKRRTDSIKCPEITTFCIKETGKVLEKCGNFY